MPSASTSDPRRAAPPARTVEVGAARLERWAAGFAERHGAVAAAWVTAGLRLEAEDGACALLAHPWGGPAVSALSDDTDVTEVTGATEAAVAAVAAFAAGVSAPRDVAVVLVRRGGYACARVAGGVVTASKVGSRYVQGRTAAGGWSQQRFARRREKQTDELVGAAVEVAVRLLLDPLPEVVATGGDRPLAERVLQDPRLRLLARPPRGRHLTVGDPRADVVRALPDLLTRVEVTLQEPV